MSTLSESNPPCQSFAAVVEKFDQPLIFKTIPLQKPTATQIIVQMELSGVCHTDLHVQCGDWKVKATLPIVPGHEGVGKVIFKGENVSNIQIGDRVCIPWLSKTCENCEYCLNKWETLCLKQERTGFSVNGTFQQFAIANSNFVAKIPPTLSNAQAAPITCAGLTVYKALKVANLFPNQFVAIVGAAGGLGHLAIQYAKYMQFCTIGIDINQNNFLKSIGCNYAFDVNKDDITSEIMNVTELGAHAVLCLAPNKNSIKQAISYLRPNGSLVIVCLPSGNIELDLFDIVIKGLKVIGSIVGTPTDLQEALDIAASGAITCHVDVLNFSEINDALDGLRKGQIKGRVAVKF